MGHSDMRMLHLENTAFLFEIKPEGPAIIRMDAAHRCAVASFTLVIAISRNLNGEPFGDGIWWSLLQA